MLDFLQNPISASLLGLLFGFYWFFLRDRIARRVPPSVQTPMEVVPFTLLVVLTFREKIHPSLVFTLALVALIDLVLELVRWLRSRRAAA